MKTSLLFVWIWWVLLESQNKLRRDEQKLLFLLFSVFREFNRRSVRSRPGQKFHMFLIRSAAVEAHSAASTPGQCCPHVVKVVNYMCQSNMMKTVCLFSQKNFKIFYIFRLICTAICCINCDGLKEKFTKNMRASWSFIVHESFLELHRKTAATKVSFLFELLRFTLKTCLSEIIR